MSETITILFEIHGAANLLLNIGKELIMKAIHARKVAELSIGGGSVMSVLRKIANWIKFSEHRDWEKLNGEDWSWLLREQPKFGKYCDWCKLDGFDWSRLLRKQPKFGKYCDWEKLSGWNWSVLLQYKPQFAEQCNWNKLNGGDWSQLLQKQPQFKRYQVLANL